MACCIYNTEAFKELSSRMRFHWGSPHLLPILYQHPVPGIDLCRLMEEVLLLVFQFQAPLVYQTLQLGISHHWGGTEKEGGREGGAAQATGSGKRNTTTLTSFLCLLQIPASTLTAAAPAPGRKGSMGTKHPPGGGGCGDGSCGGHSSKGTSGGQGLQVQRKGRSRSGPWRKRFKSSNTRGHSWYLTTRGQVHGAVPMAAGDPSEGTSSKFTSVKKGMKTSPAHSLVHVLMVYCWNQELSAHPVPLLNLCSA